MLEVSRVIRYINDWFTSFLCFAIICYNIPHYGMNILWAIVETFKGEENCRVFSNMCLFSHFILFIYLFLFFTMFNQKCVRIFHCNLTMKLHTSKPAARTICTSIICWIYGDSCKTLLLLLRLYHIKNNRHRHNIRLVIDIPKVPVM